MQGNLGAASQLAPGFAAGKRAATEAFTQAAAAALQAYAGVLRLEDPAAELRPVDTSADALGFTHARFEQVYEGLPVWGRDLYVHFDDAQQAYLINGSYEPTPRLDDLTPEIKAETALQTVVAALKADGRWEPLSEETAAWLHLEGPQTTLVLYPDASGEVRLAYDVTLHPNLIEHFTYLVDAENGRILNRIARYCSLMPSESAPRVGPVNLPSAAKSAAGSAGTFLSANALDLNGRMRSFRTWQGSDGYYLLWDLPNLNPASQLPNNPAGGALTISARNQDLAEGVDLYHVTTFDNMWTNEPTAVSAHVNMEMAYNYFQTTHGRKAIDGVDASIISIVHVTDNGRPMDNAFWNGRVMAYGDGDQLFKPMAGSADVAGHEMTHGVVQHTAGLIYQFQAGALNESFADVFGAMMDREDYLLGEDVTLRNRGIALRDLLNPDNPQVLSAQPAHMNTYRELTAEQDNGGVHVNSGIPNRAAALIIEQLGHVVTERIYYRALSMYLTRNSQFIDCRNAVVQAARDLYNAREVSAVQQAFDAVGIGASNGGGGTDNNIPPVAGGQSLIAFMTDDGAIGVLDVTNPNNLPYRMFDSPDAVARVTQDPLDRAQLSVPRSGERIYFVNPDLRLAYIELQTGAVGVFENLYLQDSEGDLWNASVDPGENYVALVSAYEKDPTLYIFDGQNIGQIIELDPETSQDGIKSQTIQYPDVVSWSPNPKVPKIAFDAFNVLPVGLFNKIEYWGIYEIDFETDKVYDLIAAQPEGVSIGNIVYSNTDPDVTAFNVIDKEGTWDVVMAGPSGVRAFQMPRYTADGQAIVDAERPTFSPTDDYLIFTSASMSKMFFYDVSDSTNVTYINLPMPFHNTRWFNWSGKLGIDTEEQAELPASVRLYENYPNPFNPSTTLRFDLTAPVEVELHVYDLMGRRVATLVRERMAAGAHTVSFDASGLASGTYLARLQAGSVSQTQAMVLLK